VALAGGGVAGGVVAGGGVAVGGGTPTELRAFLPKTFLFKIQFFASLPFPSLLKVLAKRRRFVGL